MNPLIHAITFAAGKHRDQRRKDTLASPYINHPIAVADLLANEVHIEDEITLMAAILHDTIEDTDTSRDELAQKFGWEVTQVVVELTDDKSLPRAERKRLQIANAGLLSPRARIVSLADKTCNLRDLASSTPGGWSVLRVREYFDWAREVVVGMRGTHPVLESLFDEAGRARP